MAAKEWLIPLLLAGVTFAGLTQLDLTKPAAPEGTNLLFPFQGVTTVEFPALVLALDRVDAHPPGAPLVQPGCACVDAHWLSAHVAIVPTEPLPPGCDCVGHGWSHVAVLGATHPQLGFGGYNGTRLTVNVFDGDGELIASNANASEQARLTGKYGPEQLPGGVWYIGANMTAPPGTQMPPLAARAFLPEVRSLLTGLPVGGVATTETDALAGLYGHLWITVQVAELVHAP